MALFASLRQVLRAEPVTTAQQQRSSPLTIADAAPRVLVVASSGTTSTVSAVAAKLGLGLQSNRTMPEVLSVLAQGCKPALIVAALGTTPETLLFDSRNHSTLISTASTCGIPVCVYSHTACQHSRTLQMCLDAGAIGVVNNARALKQVLESVLQAEPASMSVAGGAPSVALQAQQQQPGNSPGSHREATAPGTAASTFSSYPPIQRRLQRLQHLRAKYGEDHKRTARWLAVTSYINSLVQRTPPLAALQETPAAGAVRFVVISDTHNQHREMCLPDGEVLIHCGDFTGNYRLGWAVNLLLKPWEDQLEKELLDFADWMRGLPYRRIFLVPGNHDTPLDTEAYPQHALGRSMFLAALPSHVTLLQEAGASYRGLHLWGSPTVVSRVEACNKHYCSDGFERVEERRKAIWRQLPEDLDVLITHAPPTGNNSDHLLADALSKLKAPPRVHVWGHDHGSAGCGVNAVPGGEQLWINAAQSMLLHHEPHSGGSAWVFDVAARDS